MPAIPDRIWLELFATTENDVATPLALAATECLKDYQRNENFRDEQNMASALRILAKARRARKESGR